MATSEGTWQAYTLDTTEDQARALFAERHGYAPAEVVRSGSILLAGPVRESAKQPQETAAGPWQLAFDFLGEL